MNLAPNPLKLLSYGSVWTIALIYGAIAQGAAAQLAPDQSLGTIVTPERTIRGIPSQEITGGTLRGQNLFHSFQDFNVGEGRGVYFANPIGVANILSRVTGSHQSQILGRLGVLGEANLFLLNPNGIVFGANATLDIPGSFLATTASAVQLGETGLFSATQPQTDQLLAVDPGALFLNAIAKGTITNLGYLSTGGNLSFVADSLNLSGQLQAGKDLTLQAQDTVRIRDSATTPFVGFAGSKLLIQGNQNIDIFALNHPESGLFAGADLILRSAQAIQGDAHYFAGGNFRLEQLDRSLGALFSPFDPVIRSGGDVSFASYQGASLHILAAGSVTIPGFILVTGADPANGLVETVTLSDRSTVAVNGQTRPTVDIRAGVSPSEIGSPLITGTGFFSPPGNFQQTPASSADISIGAIAFVGFSGFSFVPIPGEVLLTNQYRPNLNLTGNIQILGQAGIGINANGGSVTIDSRGGINLAAPALSLGDPNGGNLTLLAQNDITTRDLFTSGGELGGQINIQTNGSFLADNSLIGSASSSNTTTAAGGSAVIRANRIRLTNGSRFRVFTNGTATGGDLVINADAVELTGSNAATTTSFSTTTSGTGKAGNTTIAARRLSLQNGAQIFANSSGAGQGGDLTVAADTIELTGSNATGTTSLSATTSGTGKAGNVTIAARQLSLRDGAQIFANSNGAGQGGNLTLDVSDGVELTGTVPSGAFASSLGANATASGNGGTLRLSTRQLIVQDGAQIGAGSFGEGSGGLLEIMATDSVRVTGRRSTGPSTIFTAASGTTGKAGDINLITGTLAVEDGATVTANTSGRGDGGNITIAANQVNLQNGGSIAAETYGAGKGGTINLQATDSITLSGQRADGRPSIISTESQFGATGDGNILNLTTARLTLRDGGQISSTTFGAGRGGNLSVTATDSIEVIGTGANGTSASGLQSNTVGTGETAGDGGVMSLKTNRLIVQGGAQIGAGTFGTGNGGEITVEAAQSVLISGRGLEASSGLFTSAAPGSRGRAGNLKLSTGSLRVQDTATLSSSTSGQGNGGNLQINARSIAVTDGGQLRAATSSGGDAGSIDITAIGGSVLLSGERTSLSVQTTSNIGKSGTITINTDTFSLSDSAILNASTTAAGNGGSITLNTNTLNVTGARISAQSQGTGTAGDIVLTATQDLTFDSGEVIAAATQSGGGNLTIQAGTLRLLNRSLINTSVAESTGGGGDIRIAADRFFAFQNSDILANANAGSGGNIQIAAPVFLADFFSSAERTTERYTGDISLFRNNDRVDINASSNVGISGSVTIPDFSFLQNSLSALASNFVDPSQVVAGSCLARRNAEQGSFVVTGTGGLPTTPLTNLDEWYAINPRSTTPAQAIQSRRAASEKRWKLGDPIVEAQTILETPNQQLLLVNKPQFATLNSPDTLICR